MFILTLLFNNFSISLGNGEPFKTPLCLPFELPFPEEARQVVDGRRRKTLRVPPLGARRCAAQLVCTAFTVLISDLCAIRATCS